MLAGLVTATYRFGSRRARQRLVPCTLDPATDMKASWFATLAVVVSLPCTLAGQDAAARGQFVYDSLKARLAAGDTAIDYRAFRMAYAESPLYDPYGAMTGDIRETMMTAYFRTGDPQAAREAADSLLRATYVDIDAHMIAALTSATLGDSARMTFHASIARGLTASIEQSGSGSSPDEPYEVIGVVEEDALLRMRGWRRGNHSSVTCRGQPCDRIEVSRPSTGEARVLYFDVSRPHAFLKRQTEPDA